MRRYGVTRYVLGSEIGLRIQVHGQRAVAPLVGKHVILGGIKMVDARHHIPLLAQHLSIGIFHLIAVLDVRQRVLTTHQRRCFERPQFTFLRLHQQVLVAHRAVLTVKINADMQTFAPCRMIMYREFQLHCKQIVFAKILKILEKRYTLPTLLQFFNVSYLQTTEKLQKHLVNPIQISIFASENSHDSFGSFQ